MASQIELVSQWHVSEECREYASKCHETRQRALPPMRVRPEKAYRRLVHDDDLCLAVTPRKHDAIRPSRPFPLASSGHRCDSGSSGQTGVFLARGRRARGREEDAQHNQGRAGGLHGALRMQGVPKRPGRRDGGKCPTQRERIVSLFTFCLSASLMSERLSMRYI